MSRNAFIFGLLVAVALVIGLYRAKDGARESSEEIVRLEAAVAEAYRQTALLEADLAHMSRREWIEEYARNELGMGPPRANQFATEYNLDLLIGGIKEPAVRVEESVLPESRPEEDSFVSVPVTDASNPEAKEDVD